MSASAQTDSLTVDGYFMRLSGGSSQEVKRLDDMHEGYKKFLDHELSFAPLRECQPKKILELGTGSGAWAIQAANEFPNAEVLAVDLSPLPSRPLPPNMKFQILNILDPLPFEPETFDIIHERLVFMHLPKPEQVISRVIPLLKPGGWLLMQYLDSDLRAEDGSDLGPATRVWLDRYDDLLRGRGTESPTRISDNIITASGLFSEINVKKIDIALSEHTDDPKRNGLGATMKTSFYRAAFQIAGKGDPVMTPEVVKGMNEELSDRNHGVNCMMTFMWSRRRI